MFLVYQRIFSTVLTIGIPNRPAILPMIMDCVDRASPTIAEIGGDPTHLELLMLLSIPLRRVNAALTAWGTLRQLS